MALKKVNFEENEEKIFEDAVIYTRGKYWQFRLWLTKERKYARFSLKTTSKSTALDKAKLYYHELMANQAAGKTYYSITAKKGVELYLEQRMKHVESGLIVKGRYSTISTHLEHWLNFIGRDTKLKEMERTDCEDYYASRTKNKKELPVSTTTIENEQSTVNAMMRWLYKRGEAYIDGFDFTKLKRKDKGLEANRRATFTDDEFKRITVAINEYIKEAKKDINSHTNYTHAVAAYYLAISSITGLRRGEQLQLCWNDIEFLQHKEERKRSFDLIKITVRGITSKVRSTRTFVVKDSGFFMGLLKLQIEKSGQNAKESEMREKLADQLIFSVNTKTSITPRIIGLHFNRLLKLAKINNSETRDLVPYSFRHYFITQRVNSNLPIAAIAEMCGTSITQIEKTYYHTTNEKMVSNALADYEYINGILVPR